MPGSKCQATFGTHRATNLLPCTCLWFLCKAWIATSSWHCRCWSLIAHVCHLFSFFASCILIALELPFFFHHLCFLTFWRNIRESVKWFSALFKWSSHGKRGIMLSLCESYASQWWLMSMLQIVISQCLLEKSITKTNDRIWVGFHVMACKASETRWTWYLCGTFWCLSSVFVHF